MGDTDHTKRGNMDIHVQEQTFSGFVHFCTRFVICVAVFLLLLGMFNG